MQFLRYLALLTATIVMSVGCAPITPLPGQNLPIPSMPSPSGGSPGGMPPSLPPQLPGGGLPSPPSMPSPSGGQQGGPPGQQSPSPPGQQGGEQSGGEQGGQPQSGQESAGVPDVLGGTPDPLASDSQDPNQTEDPELTWEKTENSSSSASESEWETSNESAEGGGAAGGGQQGGGQQGGGGNAGGQEGQEGELAGGGQPGGGGEEGGDEEGGQAGGGSAEDELAGALQDFDGEILAERDIARESGGASSPVELPDPQSGGGGGSGEDQSSQQEGGPVAGRPIPNQPPAPPSRTSEVPDDLPDAKDDDIIARQLREAAMQEEDPVLKEKLWDEYRRYKKG